MHICGTGGRWVNMINIYSYPCIIQGDFAGSIKYIYIHISFEKQICFVYMYLIRWPLFKIDLIFHFCGQRIWPGVICSMINSFYYPFFNLPLVIKVTPHSNSKYKWFAVIYGISVWAQIVISGYSWVNIVIQCKSVTSVILILSVLIHLVMKLKNSRKIRSISWLLMPWLILSPGHQQQWYWLCRINLSLSSMWKNFNHQCHFSFQQWSKMWIYFHVS